MSRAPLLLLLCVACASPGDGSTGSASGSTSGASTTGFEMTSSDELPVTTGAELPDGCDALIRGEDGTEALAAALGGAAENRTICVSGKFAGISTIEASNVMGLTLRGVDAGEGIGAGAVFDFAGIAGAPGLRFTEVDGLTLENFSVVNAVGDGLVVSGGQDVTIRRVRVAFDAPNNGGQLFGIRADTLTRVLVDECSAVGGADAGIFVQASTSVVVRGSHASGNVSGIELENCALGEVHDNEVEGNVIGLFVLDLPESPFGNGGDVLVRDNVSRANNLANFAPEELVVASIPNGIGALVLASDRVELRGNEFNNNDTTGVLVVSFAVVELLSGTMHMDVSYDPYPQTVEIHGNTFVDNGQMPAELLASVFMIATGPAILWDGAFDELNNEPSQRLCIRDNGDADFLNMDALNLGENKSVDLAPHDCDHPDVAPVDAG